MGVMSVISWIIFGIIIGAIARFIMPGKQAMGWIMTMILGIAGSFTGGFLGRLLFGSGPVDQIHPAGVIGSIIGALILLYIYSLVMARGGDKWTAGGP